MAGGKVVWTLDERNLIEAGRWETGVEAEAWAGSQTLAEAWAWAEALGSSEDESPGRNSRSGSRMSGSQDMVGDVAFLRGHLVN